VKRNIVSKREC